MNKARLDKFIQYLQKGNWLVFGPTLIPSEALADEPELSPFLTAHLPTAKKPEGLILIKQIEKPSELILDNRLPFFSFKRFFVPEQEILFDYQGTKLKTPAHFSILANESAPEFQKIALVGMNLLDLKAVNLYDQVFEKDPYYQARRRDILIIGHSMTPDPSGENNIFESKFEEDILEHLPFDIFIVNNQQSIINNQKSKINPSRPLPLDKGRVGLPAKAFLTAVALAKEVASAGVRSEFKVFTGSIKGQRILEHFGYPDYRHIQFSGPVKEGALDEKMVLLREKLKNHHNQKIWDELGARCIECGKCTLICPTCFCFRVDDQTEPGRSQTSTNGTRQRCWDSCYYQEFSEVSGADLPGRGQPKFLNSTSQRIHFWYFHKFARIPDEFDFMGCVGCHRCARVCPVNIDIVEVLKSVKES